MIPGLGIVRRLITSLIVMAALFAAGNVIVERMAEDKLAGVVRSTFDLDEDPLVEISGFPIILKVLNGSLPEISLRASGATVEDLTLRRVAASLEDVRIDGGLLTGGKLGARVGTGSVSAEATDEAVTRFLRAHDQKATIAFHEGGATVRTTRRIAGRNRRITATGTIRLVKNELQLTPKRVRVDGEKPPAALEKEARRKATIRVPLPDLPGGFGPTKVIAHDGYIRIEAVLEDERITLRG
jgi:hypothetical protein